MYRTSLNSSLHPPVNLQLFKNKNLKNKKKKKKLKNQTSEGEDSVEEY